MATFRKTTLRDVARRAGVSPTTVSEFLSGQTNACSAATASRIQRAVEELHYAPSALGASLRTSRTRTIGVSLLFPRSSKSPRGNFLLRLWEGITEEALAAEHSVLFYEDTIRRDLGNHRVFLDGRVDGVVFHPVLGDERPGRLAEVGLPVAVVSNYPETYPNCITVVSDERQIAELALNHLWDLGHRRIAHLAGPTHAVGEAGTEIAAARCDYYRRFLEERGAFDPDLLYEPDFWTPNTSEQNQQWRAILERWHRRNHPPTAIFCVNDAIALRVLLFATEVGWRVPEQLSVVGVDNILQGEMARPALTTIDYPMEEQGRAAIRLLFGRINAKSLPEEHPVIAGAELIVRESTAPPAR